MLKLIPLICLKNKNMKIIFTLLTLTFINLSFAQCNPTTDKMLLIGDSWAFFSWTGDSYNENFNRFGLSDINCHSTTGLAVNGAEANSYFSDAARKQELIDYVSTHPELEIIHLSLGGNDAMAAWNKNMTPQQEDVIISVIMTDIKTIIDTIWFYNPNVDIHLSGYDYPNFEETIGSWIIPSLHPFYGTWDNMGKPTNGEVNHILAKATQAFQDSVNAWNQVSFVNNLGLMQWTYGQTTPLSVAPFGIYQPQTAPVPGGFPDYPSPLDALNFSGNDSFHLNDNSFELFIKRHFEEYYWAYFRNADQTFMADDVANNGWTTLSTQGNSNLQLGNNANGEQVQIILSFDTHDMPNDVKATKASVFIKRTGLTGSNLQPENLYVSIAKGNFGESTALDTADFNDFGDASAISCTYGTVDQDGHWMRIDLDANLLPHFNKFGTTQIKLYYNVPDSDRYFDFTNSIDSIYLDLNTVYDPNTVSNEEVNANLSIEMYPNPSNQLINFSNITEKSNISIVDVNGKLVLTSTINSSSNTINIEALSNGIYFVRIANNNGISVKKLIKE